MTPEGILAVSEFPNGASHHATPSLPRLSSVEKETLLRQLRELPRMSVFLPSSCHDRAHALWMLLSAELQPKVAKTWIFAESAYTSVLRGGLVLKHRSMNRPWRYHVALVFRDTDGEISVLDPVREDWPRPVRLSEWQGELERSPNSVLPAIEVTLDPALYLFYGHNITAPANMAGAINTGEFFTYTGQSKDGDYIPRSLSRDDVAVSREASDCTELRDALQSADQLQTLLNCARSDHDAVCGTPSDAIRQAASRLRADCPSVVNLYQDRLEFWKRRLR